LVGKQSWKTLLIFNGQKSSTNPIGCCLISNKKVGKKSYFSVENQKNNPGKLGRL
jgi:hypothetical protein